MKQIYQHNIINKLLEIEPKCPAEAPFKNSFIVESAAVHEFHLLSLQNILEIVMYDEDPLKPDNLISSMVFDINSLTEGKKETKEFVLKEEVKFHRKTPL